MDDSTGGMRSHHDFDPDESQMLSRRSLLFAGAAIVGTLGIWSRSSGSSSTAAPADSSTSTTTGGQLIQTSTEPPLVPPSTAVAVVSIESDLAHDMVGPEVERLQTLLRDHGFDPGPIDGVFGGSTERSVWAFEKLVLGTPREEMRGVVTPEIWDRMNQPTGVMPRRTPGGMHLEIYLPEQVAVLFVDGAVRLISHVSSGSEIQWCDEVLIDNDDETQTTKGICGDAVTPGGVYHFERKIDGWRNGKLGRLYKPVYFNYGIAIHGAGNVPSYPASHGCVRFPMHIAEYLQDLVSVGNPVYVWDGVEEPEVYGAQPMTFDWPDPDWVPPSTTTTSTTTTSPSTTVPSTSTPPTTHATHVPDTTILPSTTTTLPPAPSTTTTTLPSV
ncbi:MAG: hypothetical protein DRJ50_12855 [Actinobacteria bacterium]|nr:MAG: hypothetical protein DRJ50_12855 [Actinomycetota bacterium]